MTNTAEKSKGSLQNYVRFTVKNLLKTERTNLVNFPTKSHLPSIPPLHTSLDTDPSLVICFRQWRTNVPQSSFWTVGFLKVFHLLQDPYISRGYGK